MLHRLLPKCWREIEQRWDGLGSKRSFWPQAPGRGAAHLLHAAAVCGRILVKDGDHVEAGQALVELDPTDAQADKASLFETRKAAQSEWLRARALQRLLSSEALSATAHHAPGARNALSQETPNDWTPADKADAQAQMARLMWTAGRSSWRRV